MLLAVSDFTPANQGPIQDQESITIILLFARKLVEHIRPTKSPFVTRRPNKPSGSTNPKCRHPNHSFIFVVPKNSHQRLDPLVPLLIIDPRRLLVPVESPTVHAETTPRVSYPSDIGKYEISAGRCRLNSRAGRLSNPPTIFYSPGRDRDWSRMQPGIEAAPVSF